MFEEFSDVDGDGILGLDLIQGEEKVESGWEIGVRLTKVGENRIVEAGRKRGGRRSFQEDRDKRCFPVFWSSHASVDQGTLLGDDGSGRRIFVIVLTPVRCGADNDNAIDFFEAIDKAPDTVS